MDKIKAYKKKMKAQLVGENADSDCLNAPPVRAGADARVENINRVDPAGQAAGGIATSGSPLRSSGR